MEKSSFFTSLNGDRKYKATDFAEYFSAFIGNGVFPNPSTNLQVIANGDMTLSLSKGLAWIDGYLYHNTDNLTLTVEHSDAALKRIDRVVLRCDFIGREIKAHIKKGIFASSPIAPSLERGVNAYEISIADVLIENGVISITQSKITDTRLDNEVCGIVTQTVDTIDTTTLYKQLEAWKKEEIASFNAWKNGEVESFNNWRTGQESTQSTWFNSTTTGLLIDFNTWFNNVKGILGEDIAGNLLNKINALESIVNNLELTSGKIIRPDGSNVEETLLANKTSISEQKIEIDNLKQSVSNGKSVVASAITDKGVLTLATDTFQTMATNITNIKDMPAGWDMEKTGEVVGSNIAENDAIVWQKYGDLEASLEPLITQPVIDVGITRNRITFDNQGKFFAITGGSSPYFNIFKIDGDTFTKLPNPSILPSQEARVCAFSPDGKYFAVGYNTIDIYTIVGDTFTKLKTLYVTAYYTHKIAFSPDGKYLGVAGYYENFLRIFRINTITDTFTEVRSVLTAQDMKDLTFSPDGKLVHFASPDGNNWTYDLSDDTNPISNNTNLPGRSLSIAYSHSGDLLAISSVSEIDKLIIYSAQGRTFTKLVGAIDVLPANYCNNITFTHDDNYLISSVGSEVPKSIYIYKRIGNTFKLINPINEPSFYTKYHVNSADGKFLAIQNGSSATTIYRTQEKKVVMNYNMPNIPLIKLNSRYVGVAQESKNIGEQINVNLFPKLNMI